MFNHEKSLSYIKRHLYKIFIMIINALLIICLLSITIIMKNDNKVIEEKNSQLTAEIKDLQDVIDQLQSEVAQREDEYIELHKSLAEDKEDHSDLTYTKQEEYTENRPIISLSLDKKYYAITYGTVTSITAGGLYPYKTIHVFDADTDEIIWTLEPGGYTVDFIWSPDSRYLGIYYTGRTWGESVVVDMKDIETITLPVIDTIASHYDIDVKPQENRPDPIFKITGWENSETVIVDFSWTKTDEEKYNSQYYYNLKTNEVNYR